MTTMPKDYHDESWAVEAALLDTKTARSLIDAVSLIVSRPEAISDGLEVELAVFTEAVQSSHVLQSRFHDECLIGRSCVT